VIMPLADLYGIKPAVEEVIPKKRIRIEKSWGTGKYVWLSDRIRINIADKEKLINWGILGKSGTGKTTALMLIANQYKNALIFDSKGGAIKTIKKFELDDWEFYKVGDDGKGKKLTINVYELPPTIINVLYSGASISEKRRISSLSSFLRPMARKRDDLMRVLTRKNYNTFQEVLENVKLDYLFHELELILHPKDNGMDLSELCRGKKVVDVSTYDYKNRSVGVLIDALFYRVKKSSKLQRERFLIGVDDIQRIGASDTAIGTAMGKVFSECRQFNISGLVSGTNVTRLDPLVKQNISIKLIFETEYDREALRKMYDIYFDEYTLEEKAKVFGKTGTALLKTDDGLGYEEGTVVHIDLDYFYPPEQEEEKEVPNYDTSFIDTF